MARRSSARRTPLTVSVALALLATMLMVAPSPAAAATASISTDGTVTGTPGSTIYPFADAVISGSGTMDGITIRVANGFNSTIDRMSTSGSHAGIAVTYTIATGLLRLRGTASTAAYQAALRDVTYTQTSTTQGSRTFIVVAGTAIYLPDTGNLYQYVNVGSNITWTAARAAALARTFGPYAGYLANISSQVENDVALAELTGNTWIGASDEAVEGEWRWMDGPEAGQQFWQGASVGSGGAPVSSGYNNWQGPEPNNAGGEDYAHMFSGTGEWNDYPDSLSVTGYLVEYQVDDIGSVASLVRLLIGTDTDGDGVSDGDETGQGTDPNDPDDYLDTDGDGVPDSVEIADGTDPNNPSDGTDSDGDGLSDYEEGRLGSSPLSGDSDGDGVGDGVEVAGGSDPTDPTSFPDADGDEVSDTLETAEGTDPNDPNDFPDTDGDGVPDSVEVAEGTDPNNGADANDADTDGLSDYDERQRGTDPTDADSDDDGVPDAVEVAEGSNPTNPASFADTDGDGVPNQVETDNGTDPANASDFPDTDGDGISDYAVSRGASPRPRHCGFDYAGAYGADTNRQAVARLYLALFRRTPDTDGLNYWTDLADGGVLVGDIKSWFLDSDEFANRYASLSNSQYVQQVYDSLLCRTSEDGAASYWTDLLDGPNLNRRAMIESVFDGPEFAARVANPTP